MAATSSSDLSQDVNSILFVRSLPIKATSQDLYDLFGKYGGIRQIRMGTTPETKGSAYIVYNDILDAKSACESLNGFNLSGRYLIVLYFKPSQSSNVAGKVASLSAMKETFGV